MRIVVKFVVTLILFTSIAYAAPKNCSSSKFTLFHEKLPDDAIVRIASLLEDKNVAKLAMTNKRIGKLLSSDYVEGGKSLRSESKFAVTDEDGRVYFLDEFIFQPEYFSISKVKNVTLLAQNNLEKFIKLVLKSCPSSRENIERNLESFYKDTIKIDELVSSLPTYETAQEKLAAILLEMLIWNFFPVEATEQVIDELNFQLDTLNLHQRSYTILECAAVLIMEQVVAGNDDYFWQQMIHQTWELMSGSSWDRLRSDLRREMRLEIRGKIRGRVINVLSEFDFATAYNENRLSETLKSAINYDFMVYQLATITMRHSESFKLIMHGPLGLVANLKKIISESEAQSILDSLTLQEAPEGNYLIKTQLNILKRHLPNQGQN